MYIACQICGQSLMENFPDKKEHTCSISVVEQKIKRLENEKNKLEREIDEIRGAASQVLRKYAYQELNGLDAVVDNKFMQDLFKVCRISNRFECNEKDENNFTFYISGWMIAHSIAMSVSELFQDESETIDFRYVRTEDGLVPPTKVERLQELYHDMIKYYKHFGYLKESDKYNSVLELIEILKNSNKTIRNKELY